MKKNLPLLFLVFTALSFSSNGQSTSAENNVVDEYVKTLGPLDNLNVATIADTISRKFDDKKDKVRAIFYWLTNNISWDLKAMKANDPKNNDPVKVIQYRKATPLGYSLLLQEMCSLANIRCLSVDGYIKNFPEDINNKPDEINHSWNVVQLGQSPEQWFYIDAAKASGYADKKMSIFTKHFTSEYFFADRTLFNLDHYPNNGAWQLGGGPKNIKEFFALPVISDAAYEYGLKKLQPATGYLKSKTDKAVIFSYTYNGKGLSSVVLVIGDEKKGAKSEPMNFSATGSILTFSYQFKKEDEYPVKVMIDGKEFVSYYIESSE
ncbi:MAG: transglutaminase domain-containing protein [Ferruginibacter sp.]